MAPGNLGRLPIAKRLRSPSPSPGSAADSPETSRLPRRGRRWNTQGCPALARRHRHRRAAEAVTAAAEDGHRLFHRTGDFRTATEQGVRLGVVHRVAAGRRGRRAPVRPVQPLGAGQIVRPRRIDRVAAVDVGAPGAADAVRAVLGDLPPVRGVIHAAGVEAGALLMNTTPDDLAAAMRPKVDGMLTLHEVFPPGRLYSMVLFSSCGYLAGFPGQGAYACGNAYLDAMARHRRALGDRTISVAWTAWRGLGMGSTSGFVAAAVPMLVDVAPTDADARQDAAPALPDRGDVDVAEWAGGQVLAAVAHEFGCAADEVDANLPLVELGVDSIMTVALRRQLERQTGLALPPTLLWEHPTAAAVTDRIVELLSAGEDPAAWHHR